MASIVSYGAYIPLHRLPRSEIARAWGRPSVAGEKAVANHDEDSITMAVAATLDCLKGIDYQKVDGLYFASTTSPYKEKQVASIIAAALGLRRQITTGDFSGSLRAGTTALRAALDAVKAGSARSILVTSADTRLGYPRGESEMSFGDGAAAILVGDSEIAVTVEGDYALSDELMDVWRSDGDTFVRSAEDRFGREAGYMRVVSEAVSGALQKHNLTPNDFAGAFLYAPDARQLGRALTKSGFAPKLQAQDLLYNQVGNTGAAFALMLLVAAMEEAKVGDRLLLASYGDGCDVFVLKVAEGIENNRNHRGIKKHLELKKMIPSYNKYVLWRQLMAVQPPPRPPVLPLSPPALWRDRDWGLSLHGSKCKRCGTPQYPMQRVCAACQAEDEYEPYSFADKVGKVFTFSHDNLAAAIDPPTTIAVVDFEGGGRITCDVTDCDPEEVRMDMLVEMTFRKLHQVSGIHNYWWKATPIRF